MSKSHTVPGADSSIQMLKNYIDDFACVLDKDTFYSRELPGELYDRKATINRLKVCGAIESVEKIRLDTDTHGTSVHKWTWKNHRERLQEYVEDRNELPCGCRSHVPPERTDSGEFVCKFCGATHSEETIKEAL